MSTSDRQTDIQGNKDYLISKHQAFTILWYNNTIIVTIEHVFIIYRNVYCKYLIVSLWKYFLKIQFLVSSIISCIQQRHQKGLWCFSYYQRHQKGLIIARSGSIFLRHLKWLWLTHESCFRMFTRCHRYILPLTWCGPVWA